MEATPAAVPGFSLVAERGPYSAPAPRALRGAVACMLRGCSSRALERGLSSCGALLNYLIVCGVFPDEGSHPTQGLTGTFLTTGPPGQS